MAETILERLHTAQAKIMVDICGGEIEIETTDELDLLFRDRIQFIADYWGVSRETINAWIDFYEDGCRCKAPTRKGKQCQIVWKRRIRDAR